MQAVSAKSAVAEVRVSNDLRETLVDLQTTLGRYLAGSVVGDILEEVKTKLAHSHKLLVAILEPSEDVKKLSVEISAVSDFIKGRSLMINSIDTGEVFEGTSSIMTLARLRISNSFDLIMNTAASGLVERIRKVNGNLK